MSNTVDTPAAKALRLAQRAAYVKGKRRAADALDNESRFRQAADFLFSQPSWEDEAVTIYPDPLNTERREVNVVGTVYRVSSNGQYVERYGPLNGGWFDTVKVVSQEQAEAFVDLLRWPDRDLNTGRVCFRLGDSIRFKEGK